MTEKEAWVIWSDLNKSHSGRIATMVPAFARALLSASKPAAPAQSEDSTEPPDGDKEHWHRLYIEERECRQQWQKLALPARPTSAVPAQSVDRYRKALYQIACWPDGGSDSGQKNIKKFALSILDGDPPVGELDPHDALRYMACRDSAIERGLFATPEEYDAMVDDSLRKNGKEVLTGRGHNYGKKVAKDGSLYRPNDDQRGNQS